MDYRLKNGVFQVLERLPCSARLHYLLQKHVMHSFRFTEQKRMDAFTEKVQRHLDAFAQFDGKAPSQSVCYEFGSGWDLFAALGMSCAGMEQIRCIDLRPLIHGAEIASAAAFYARNAERLGVSVPDDAPLPTKFTDLRDALRLRYRIRYDAPCDARATGFAPDGIDYIYSNMVLEHIPACDIETILAECRRILRPGGVFSATIDYQDHWSYADPSITVYHFLSFTDDAWAKRNPDMHYQNRLRHSDYVRMAERSGLQIVQITPMEIREKDRAALRSVTLADRFRAYDTEDLLVRGAHFVLRKAAP